MEGLASIYRKKLPEDSFVTFAQGEIVSIEPEQLLLTPHQLDIVMIRVVEGKLLLFGEGDWVLATGELYSADEIDLVQSSGAVKNRNLSRFAELAGGAAQICFLLSPTRFPFY